MDIGIRKVTDDLYWIGVNVKRLNMFENMIPIPYGISCNSYLLLDEKTVVFDTVDKDGTELFLQKLKSGLNGRNLDYLVIHHVECDHAFSIAHLLKEYPNCKVVTNLKAFILLEQFNTLIKEENKIIIKNNESICFGKHCFSFIFTPMVHWPEVMMSYDSSSKVLFSADAFGSFGTLDGSIFNDELDYKGSLLTKTRAYYTNIVGRYGNATKIALDKAGQLDIEYICSLHGPIYRTNLDFIVDVYRKWALYEPEEKGVVIIYGSMYGNTENVAQMIASEIKKKCNVRVEVYDASITHVSELVARTFKYKNIVIACPTFNECMYPPIHEYLNHLEINTMQKRVYSIVENGSWNIKSGKLVKNFIEQKLKNSVVQEPIFTITSTYKNIQEKELLEFVDNIVESINE